MQLQTQSALLTILAVILWSTVASAFKISLRFLDPLQLVFLASVFSCFALLIVLLVQNKLRLLASLPKKHFLFCFLLGLLNPCLYYFCLFEAYNRLAAQEALAINYSWPMVLVLLSVFFLGQRLGWRELLAVLLGYCGVVVVATQGEFSGFRFDNPVGVGFALLSTLVWAGFWVFNLKHQQDTIVTLCFSFLCALPVLGICVFVFSPFQTLSLQGIAGAAYVGLFEMGFTFAVWLAALRLSTNTARVSSLAFATPFLSLVVIYLVLGEAIKPATLAGLVLVVAGIALQTLARQNSDLSDADR